MLQKCKVKCSKYVKYKYFGIENRYNLKYKDRISDKEFQSQLSAKQLAKSVLHLDWEEQIQIMFDTAPRRLLLGDTPRSIDE
jgi:hypothetical protein